MLGLLFLLAAALLAFLILVGVSFGTFAIVKVIALAVLLLVAAVAVGVGVNRVP